MDNLKRKEGQEKTWAEFAPQQIPPAAEASIPSEPSPPKQKPIVLLFKKREPQPVLHQTNHLLKENTLNNLNSYGQKLR